MLDHPADQLWIGERLPRERPKPGQNVPIIALLLG